MLNGSRIVPVSAAGTRRPVGRRSRSKRRKHGPHKKRPDDEAEIHEVSEIFDMDEGDATEVDLIDHVLRRGPVRGRKL